MHIAPCPHCCMPTLLHAHIAACPHCCMPTLLHAHIAACSHCGMPTLLAAAAAAGLLVLCTQVTCLRDCAHTHMFVGHAEWQATTKLTWAHRMCLAGMQLRGGTGASNLKSHLPRRHSRTSAGGPPPDWPAAAVPPAPHTQQCFCLASSVAAGWRLGLMMQAAMPGMCSQTAALHAARQTDETQN